MLSTPAAGERRDRMVEDNYEREKGDHFVLKDACEEGNIRIGKFFSNTNKHSY